MPYAVEHVTLPARFIATMAHLVATLTIVFDLVRSLPDDVVRVLAAWRAHHSPPDACHCCVHADEHCVVVWADAIMLRDASRAIACLEEFVLIFVKY